MSLPWFRRFPKDQISNLTLQSLSLTERGAYDKLLDYIWLELPDSPGIQAVPKILAHCIGIKPSLAVKITQKLVRLDLLQLQDGCITCTKLRVESTKITSVIHARKLAGSIGGSKHMKINVDTKAIAKQLLSKCSPIQISDPDPDGSRSYLVDNKQDIGVHVHSARAPTSSSIRINTLQESLFVGDCSPTIGKNDDSRDPLLFDKFWQAYPKKVGKPRAQAAWYRLKPNNGLSDLIIAGLERWKLCEQWLSDGGRYVPYPATWLNDHRWEYSPADEHSKHESGEQWLKRVRAERELETNNSRGEDDND